MFIFTKLIDIVVGIVWFGASRAYGFQKKLKLQLLALKKGLASESVETQEMLACYSRFLQGKASKEDLKEAHAQLRDIFRTAGLGVLVVLPFSFLSLPILVKVGERFGIRVLPSSFQKEKVIKPEDDISVR